MNLKSAQSLSIATVVLACICTASKAEEPAANRQWIRQAAPVNTGAPAGSHFLKPDGTIGTITPTKEAQAQAAALMNKLRANAKAHVAKGSLVPGEYVSPPIEVSPGDPMWKRYVHAGEKCFWAGDNARSKKYYLAALDLLTKDPKSADFGAPKPALLRLQRDILSLYPRYPNRNRPPAADPEKQLKVSEDEIAVLSKVQKVNKLCGVTEDVLEAGLVRGQLFYAKRDVEEQKNKISSQPGAEN